MSSLSQGTKECASQAASVLSDLGRRWLESTVEILKDLVVTAGLTASLTIPRTSRVRMQIITERPAISVLSHRRGRITEPTGLGELQYAFTGGCGPVASHTKVRCFPGLSSRAKPVDTRTCECGVAKLAQRQCQHTELSCCPRAWRGTALMCAVH